MINENVGRIKSAAAKEPTFEYATPDEEGFGPPKKVTYRWQPTLAFNEEGTRTVPEAVLPTLVTLTWDNANHNVSVQVTFRDNDDKAIAAASELQTTAREAGLNALLGISDARRNGHTPKS